jgi:hypothetical protein
VQKARELQSGHPSLRVHLLPFTAARCGSRIDVKLRRMMFGTKSEKVAREIEQLELKLEELETRQAERAEAVATSNTARTSPHSARCRSTSAGSAYASPR